MTRRRHGTGSVKWRPDRGKWVAKVILEDGTSRTRLAPTREEAERAAIELRELYAEQLGYYYRLPRPFFHGTREVRPRQGLSLRVRWIVLERDKFRCRYCGAAAPDVRLQVDHVMPVSEGGNDEPDNLVAACEACNQGKANKVIAS